MAMVLYSKKDTGGFAVEAAFAKAGVAYDLVNIDTAAGQHTSAEFGRINPMHQVPAVVMEDGWVMTESAAIVMHLCNLYPDKGLAPVPGTAAHARFLRWMLFMATNLYETDLRYAYPARYTADTKGVEGVKTAASTQMARCFTVIEAALEPWVAGDVFSIADAYLAMLTAWSPQRLALPKIEAVRSAVAADPAYGPIWERHGFATKSA